MSSNHKNWTYTIRPGQMDVPIMYSKELYVTSDMVMNHHIIIHSLMSDYQKRMSTANMRAYTRAGILTYNEIGMYFEWD